MNLDLKTEIVGLTDFARNTRRHTEELTDSHRPRVLTHNGRAALVVMSVEAFQELSAEAEEHRLDLRLRKALDDYADGDRGQPAAKVLRRIRKGRGK